MPTVVKSETPLVIPRSVQRRAGIKAGDRIEFRVSGGTIVVSSAGRTLRERLDEAEKGPFHGPFASGAELTAYLKKFKQSQASSTKRGQ